MAVAAPRSVAAATGDGSGLTHLPTPSDTSPGAQLFDLGVSLHSCGLLTDGSLEACVLHRAAFALCPCCYGQITTSHASATPPPADVVPTPTSEAPMLRPEPFLSALPRSKALAGLKSMDSKMATNDAGTRYDPNGALVSCVIPSEGTKKEKESAGGGSGKTKGSEEGSVFETIARGADCTAKAGDVDFDSSKNFKVNR